MITAMTVEALDRFAVGSTVALHLLGHTERTTRLLRQNPSPISVGRCSCTCREERAGRSRPVRTTARDPAEHPERIAEFAEQETEAVARGSIRPIGRRYVARMRRNSTAS